MRLPSSLFISGTDTGVGKTVVAAVLMTGLDAIYWKPVQSGCIDGSDREWVQLKSGLPPERFAAEAYRLSLPLSPHAAAAHDGVAIDLEAITPPAVAPGRALIVEGAGGLLVPLNDDSLMIDLAVRLGLPVLLVARSGLGTLNHTLLSLEALERRRLGVVGVVMNGPRNRSNREAIERYGGVPVVAEIEPLPALDPGTLSSCFLSTFGVSDG
mgnify:CR=1 FL=1